MAWPLHRFAVNPKSKEDGFEVFNVLLRYSFVATAAILLKPNHLTVDTIVFGKNPNNWGWADPLRPELEKAS